MEYVESIPIGMISFEQADAPSELITQQPYQQWDDDYDPTVKRRTCVGDALALGALNALELKYRTPVMLHLNFFTPHIMEGGCK